ncbi:MAG: tetratricopeptide repeat protein [Sulfurihydrogenibium sp.]|jgi:tetratricopeptide (TPR) repeat protein|nr:tetratricopeptide repeat protein [Sulfurihydrogenibium sp.]
MKRKLIISAVAIISLVGISIAGSKLYNPYPNFPKEMEKECLIAYNLVGSDPSYKPKFEKCIEESAKMDEKQGNYERAYDTLEALGDVRFSEEDYDNAERYFLKALEDVKKMKDKEAEALVYTQLGDVYVEKGDMEKAKDYYIKAYSDYKAIGKQMDAKLVLEFKLEKLDES